MINNFNKTRNQVPKLNNLSRYKTQYISLELTFIIIQIYQLNKYNTKMYI